MKPLLLLALLLVPLAPPAAAEPDPYEVYVNTSRDFLAVKQDKAFCYKAFPSWTYMPWTYQWNPGYTNASGAWSIAHGYNGAFVDHAAVGEDAERAAKVDWMNRFKLRFYVDHLARKHYLHLWDGNESAAYLPAMHKGGVRIAPVNGEMVEKLERYIRENLRDVKDSPYRAAYALDDEISWGHFVHPTMWCVTDDKTAYAKWLREIYGPDAPVRDKWITYDDIRLKLKDWTLKDFDASALMDQWTFNDSLWNNTIGDLVTFTNSLDPATPCGFVGGQCPNAFGGYDYAKVMRKVQFIEAYNLGSSQAIIRSFNPHNAIPTVTTHFHKSANDDLWQIWYYLAHGNRGFIGWVEGWFDGKTPRPWHDQVAPHFLEAANKIGPLVAKAEWVHDGVAIYYSHASLQLGWILDAEAHGKTWTRRNGDDRLGASHHVRHAWENMLRDSGIQYNFVSYADVIQHGVPREYKVLILPACLCLSDVEERRIEAFCRAGGTVIADYLPGYWDQHGKGKPANGPLAQMFGVAHGDNLTASKIFGGTLWAEVDQDANFSWKTYTEFLTHKNTCLTDPSGFHKVIRGGVTDHVNRYGKGTAVVMNLSPQFYNAFRETGPTAAAKGKIFMKHIANAGVHRWVEIADADPATFGYEITYWTKDGRTLLFLCQNPELIVSQEGGGNAAGLKAATVPITLRFTSPIKDARNERTGAALGDGKSFGFDWTMNEAVVMSFAGTPGR